MCDSERFRQAYGRLSWVICGRSPIPIRIPRQSAVQIPNKFAVFNAVAVASGHPYVQFSLEERSQAKDAICFSMPYML
jgi:hypothetical protein